VQEDGRDLVADVSLDIHSGEIVGVAGVEGNGQAELVQAIMGLERLHAGSISLTGQDISHWDTRRRQEAGIAYIPEDRTEMGLLLSSPLWENAMLGHQTIPPFSQGPWINVSGARERTKAIIRDYNVLTPGPDVTAQALSGGNQQKLIVGRELARRPSLIIAAQPTRGLDLAATAFVHQELDALRAEGRGVLLVSLDLTEIMTLSDRILVMSRGAVVGAARPSDVDEETLGLLMTRGRVEHAPAAEVSAGPMIGPSDGSSE
jgi:simple sugar transport system ATP-binding protein